MERATEQDTQDTAPTAATHASSLRRTFEEELQTAKGVKQAAAAGFARVFLTILDTPVASLISAAFLFQFGTGPIRGFATTLTIGLLSNVFTAVFVSRTMFELLLSRRAVAKLSI